MRSERSQESEGYIVSAALCVPGVTHGQAETKINEHFPIWKKQKM